MRLVCLVEGGGMGYLLRGRRVGLMLGILIGRLCGSSGLC